ncbi:MAG: YeeE/YedE family protein [Bdellovibrio sp.]|nr:MAG: YeeE/YedE family protein [Bdellovibrio sp.]
MKEVLYILSPVMVGILFALGLGISGMTEPKNVIAFLDFLGAWKGDLMFVMGGAIATYMALYKLITQRVKRPLLEKEFSIPSNKKIDRRLIIGASLFGVGWGITGLCPGTGLVGLVTGNKMAVIFVLSMLLGMALGRSSFVSVAFKKVRR